MLYPVKIEFKDYPSGSWQDWSEYLLEAPTISTKVESENEGEAGVIVFDNASTSFKYDIGSPVYSAFSIDLSSKQRYLFRISAVKTDKTYVQLFEGIADFSTLKWLEYGKAIGFEIIDKLSALNILQSKPVRTLRSLKDSTAEHLPWLVPLNYAAGEYYEIYVGPSPDSIFQIVKYTGTPLTPTHINIGSTVPVVKAGTILVRIEPGLTKYQFARTQYYWEGNYPGENDNWVEPTSDSDDISGAYRIDSTSDDCYLVADPTIKLKYFRDQFYSDNISNTSYYYDNTDGIWKTAVTSFDGKKMLDRLISSAWPEILITYRGLSIFNLPFMYWRQTLDENPFGKDPLDALKLLANSMNCYIYVDRTGNVIVQSKSALSTSGTTRSIGTTKIISGPEKSYFWDKLADGAEVNVTSWVQDAVTGNLLVGSSVMTKQPTGTGFTNTQIIKPKNSIKRDILVGDDTIDTQEELDALAASEALSILNFYGLRHAAFDLILNLDDNTINWELIDNLLLDSLTTFFTNLDFDLVERTLTLKPVEVVGHDYDFRQLVFGAAESSGSSIISNSGSGGGSYYTGNPIFNLPLQMSGGIVSLGITDNLKLTADKLDAAQALKTTDTPTFNQMLLSTAATLYNHAVRADRTLQITTNAPLTGGGIAIDLTANRSWTLGINTANLLGTTNQVTVVNGSGVILGLNNVTLSLPQNIHTGATPTFNQLALSSAGSGSSNAVRADRLISTSYPLTGGGNLTADRTIGLSYNATNLKLTSNALDTIQSIATTASPTFNQLTLSAAGTGTSNAVRADRTLQINTNAPLTGGGIAVDLTANRSWTLGINSANLLGTTNQITVTNGTGVVLGTNNVTLNLPQDIHTGASPTFAGETINGNILQSTNAYIKNNFNSGWTGSGWQLDYGVSYANQSTLQVDNLWVRGSMTVYELVINQIRATNGSMFVSSTAVVKDTAVGQAGDISIIFESDNNLCPFAVGDILLMQRFDIKNTLLRKIAGRVEQVSGNMVDFTYLYRYNNQEPIKGDVFVRVASSVATRQGSIYLSSDDVNAPFIDIKDGVTNYTDWSDSTKIKVRLGKLTGLTDSNFGALSGYGLYTTNAYLKGGIWATFGNIAGWSIASTYISKSVYNATIDMTNIVNLDASSTNIGLHLTIDNNYNYDLRRLSVGTILNADGTVTNDYGIAFKSVDNGTLFELSTARNVIAGWNIISDRLYSGGLTGSGSAGIELNSSSKFIDIHKDNSNYIKEYYTSTSDWGIKGVNGGSTLFQLGSTNQIAGWTFDTTKFSNNEVRLEASASLKGLGVNDGSNDVVKVGSFANASESYFTSTMPNAPNPSSAWTVEINVNNRLVWNSYGANFGWAYPYSSDFTSYQWRTYMSLPINDVKGKTISISFGIAEQESLNGTSKLTNIWGYIKTDVGTYALQDITPTINVYLLGETPTYQTRTLVANIPSNATYARFYLAWYKNAAFDPADVLLNNWSFLVYSKTIVELNQIGLSIFNSPISRIKLNNNVAEFNIPTLSCSNIFNIGNWSLSAEAYIEGDGITLNERLALKYKGVAKGYFSSSTGAYTTA